jgi:hypothetical protein
MGRLAEQMTQAIWDTQKSDALLKQGAELVYEVAKGNFHRDQIRTQPFTEKVKVACEAARGA